MAMVQVEIWVVFRTKISVEIVDRARTESACDGPYNGHRGPQRLGIGGLFLQLAARSFW